MFSESKINTVSSLINSCKIKLGKVENEIMVKDKKLKIKEMMGKNVSNMMKNNKIKKRITFHEDTVDRNKEAPLEHQTSVNLSSDLNETGY